MTIYIRSTCKNIKELLMLWDFILSLVHTEYPTVEDCNTTQQFIDAAISIGDEMGMSRTKKKLHSKLLSTTCSRTQ